jgi:hypothetical protein
MLISKEESLKSNQILQKVLTISKKILQMRWLFFGIKICFSLGHVVWDFFLIAKWRITDDPKTIRDNYKVKEEQKMGACNAGSQKVMPVTSRGVEILEVGKRK